MVEMANAADVTIGVRATEHLEIPGRKVSLDTILSKEYRAHKKGDFVEVRLIHSFLTITPWNRMEAHFIFADEQTHISAIAYDNHEVEVPRMYSLLKEGQCYRLKQFGIMTAGGRYICKEDPSQSLFVLRNQFKRLKLRNCDRDAEEIWEDVRFPFLKELPFRFLDVERVNKNLRNGTLIDLFAFVRSAGTSRNGSYQIAQLVGTPPNCQDTNTEYFINLSMYDRFNEITFNPTTLYGFSNIQVKNDPMFSYVSLKTTMCSVVMELTNENMMTEIPQLSDTSCDAISDSSFQESSEEMQDIWEGDEHFYSLCQLFSQGTTLQCGSTSLSSTSISQLQSAPFTSEVHGNAPSVTPICMDTNSESCNHQKCETSCKRKFITTLETSHSKKLRQDPPVTDPEVSRPTAIVRPTTIEPAVLPEQDSIEDIYPYKVVVTPSTVFMDTHRTSYHMRSKIRGIALILNNVFWNTPKERRGSQVDVVYLTEYLKKCNFNVVTKSDVMSCNFRDAIHEFKQKIQEVGPNNFDALFVAVLSHGLYGAVEMADEMLIPLYNDVIHQFDEYNYPCLQGKPKIFLVQTCQNMPSWNDLRFVNQVMTPPQKTGMKNMIVCHSGSPGTKSYRDIYLGSPFVSTLVHVLMTHSHICHFEEMLKMTQERLENAPLVNIDGELTCSWSPFRFKHLYFNPGL